MFKDFHTRRKAKPWSCFIKYFRTLTYRIFTYIHFTRSIHTYIKMYARQRDRQTYSYISDRWKEEAETEGKGDKRKLINHEINYDMVKLSPPLFSVIIFMAFSLCSPRGGRNIQDRMGREAECWPRRGKHAKKNTPASISPFFFYPLFLPICLYISACLSVCVSICLSVCLSICLSVCLPVCMSMCACLLEKNRDKKKKNHKYNRRAKIGKNCKTSLDTAWKTLCS